MSVSAAALEFRQGEHADLRTAFAIGELAVHETARRSGVLSTPPPSENQIETDWHNRRDLLEFTAAQDGGGFWVCEDEGRAVAYGRVCRFEEMEQLTELMVLPEYHRNGIGRALLDRLWPTAPTPELGRLVVAAGAPADLTLYADFGVMPVTGHWHMRAYADEFRERRAQEIDSTDPPAHVLSPERAVAEWKRLEPPAIGHQRPMLHDFFGRTRTCLATMDASATRATALCWVDSSGQVGPAVGATSQDLVPVVLQALDRVAMTRRHETLAIFCSTHSWWLLRRLRQVCFRVWWPSWVMCSVPLPGLDRYVPSQPPHLL